VTGSYRFGRFELCPATRKLLVEDQPVALGARAFDVLLALIERRERLVTKDELLALAWPGLVVEENNLQVQVSTLRKVLGNGVIETVAGKGYRFAAQLEPDGSGEPPPQSAAPASNRRRFGPRVDTPWVFGIIAGLAGLAVAAWATYRITLAPPAPAPYSAEDRRMTFGVVPLTAPAADPTGAQVAATVTEQAFGRLDAQPLWGQVASRRRVDEALTRHAGLTGVAKDLDVHFLLRGSVAPVSTGYNVELLLIDGHTERVIDRGSLVVGQGPLTPRMRWELGRVVEDLGNRALDFEVQRARSKPDAALDVRDLTFRAVVDWQHRKKQRDEEGAYTTATTLLNRALALAPDDRLALQMTAVVNLCDCVEGWSRNIAEQHAIGEAALDKVLQRDPSSTSMLLVKSDLLSWQGRFEEALLLVESVIAREPDRAGPLAVKAHNLLKLGRPREAAAAIDDALTRAEGYGYTMTAAAIYYVLADYERSTLFAQSAKSQMTREQLANPRFGTVGLTLVASQARQGRRDRAQDALNDFKASVPGIDSISGIRKWMHPGAELAGYEPLYEGLRLAGMPD
jgi:DNA-binding winged helix-turn-helix (wHTH) protein/tetratricopeptide (TPR) repeat protein